MTLKTELRRKEPYYHRVFDPNETKEIRLYGISGRDSYKVEGQASGDVRIRIIGGDEKDSIVLNGYGKKVHIYDNKGDNVYELNSSARRHLSDEKSVHEFDYDAFRPEKKGIKPLLGYNDEDRLFVGLGYTWLHQSFRKKPYAFKQTLGVNYSISQKAFSGTYTGIFPEFAGHWDMLLKGNYDEVRWTNFFGLGNETSNKFDSANYYRFRSKQASGMIAFDRLVGKNHIALEADYHSVSIIKDPGKFYTQRYLPTHPQAFTTDHYAGANFHYNITAVNDSTIPERGVIFTAKAGYNWDLQDDHKSYGDFRGKLEFFVPLVRTLSLAITLGGQTITGSPEFYDYPHIGGGENLRGFKKERFYGKTTFYNSNELRFLGNFRTHIMNGKAGLVAFYDNGRVWMPGENSDTWHSAYGGGILLAPFNVVLFDVTYGISQEDKLIQLRIRKKF